MTTNAENDGTETVNTIHEGDSSYNNSSQQTNSPTQSQPVGTTQSTEGAPASSAGRVFTHKVYVGSLPIRSTEKDVYDLFASSSVSCPVPARVDMKSGYAFVHFDGGEGLEAAIPLLNGSEILGSRVRVEMSRSNVERERVRARMGPSDMNDCYECGESGHWARDCPRRRDGRRPSRRRSPSPYARRRSPPPHSYGYGDRYSSRDMYDNRDRGRDRDDSRGRDRDYRDSRDGRDGRDSRSRRDGREGRDSRDVRDGRDRSPRRSDRGAASYSIPSYQPTSLPPPSSSVPPYGQYAQYQPPIPPSEQNPSPSMGGYGSYGYDVPPYGYSPAPSSIPPMTSMPPSYPPYPPPMQSAVGQQPPPQRYY